MGLRWKLREHVEERGLTLYRVSAATGIHMSSLWNITNSPEVRRVHAQTLGPLCDYLELAVGDLLEWVPDPDDEDG